MTEHLGFPHWDYLLDYLSGKQIYDWFRYCRQVGRLGVDRNDVLFAIVARSMAGGDLEKYMPYYDRFLEDDEEFLRCMESLPGKNGEAKGG